MYRSRTTSRVILEPRLSFGVILSEASLLRLAQRSLRMTKEESFTDEASLRFRMT